MRPFFQKRKIIKDKAERRKLGLPEEILSPPEPSGKIGEVTPPNPRKVRAYRNNLVKMEEAISSGQIPKVLDEFKTIELLMNGYSFSRYGDGEIKHMSGQRNVSQFFVPTLQLALKQAFTVKVKGHLVGIPNVYSRRAFNPTQIPYILSMQTRFLEIVNLKTIYGSAYISRADLCGYLSFPGYWAVIMELWRGRDVVLVCGDEKRAGVGLLFEQARNLRILRIPAQHAWGGYDELFNECMRSEKENLYLLCAGPTATVLAWSLAQKGRQAVDLGHLGMFYRQWIGGVG